MEPEEPDRLRPKHIGMGIAGGILIIVAGVAVVLLVFGLLIGSSLDGY